MLLSTITFMFFGNLTAQDQFRLSDYKNPDYKWQRLDLGFGLGGTNSFLMQDIENGIKDKNFINRFQSEVSAAYYSTKNSEHYQGYLNFGLLGDFFAESDHDKNITDNLDVKQKTNNQNIYLNAKTVNRFYGKRKQFVEINLDLDGQLYNSVEKNTAQPEELPFLNKKTDNIYQLSASLPLLIGKGRIEEVQDARLAVYIMDDLLKSGDLKRAPTSDEILAFSQFITQTKNQRFFDSRIRKIAEITAIDSFLTVVDLKAKSDASYYTLLNDNWDNANGPVRRTGGRFSVGFMPGIDLYSNESQNYLKDTLNNPDIIESYTHRSTDINNSWNIDAVALYTWEKPVNLYWQHVVNASIAYSLYYKQMTSKIYEMDTLYYEGKSKLDSPNLNLNLGYSIGYYPNSRTHLDLGLVTTFYKYWGDEKFNNDVTRDAGKISVDCDLNLSCYYYISQQVRFSIWISSTYSYSKLNQELPVTESGERNSQYFYFRYGASLTYSIF